MKPTDYSLLAVMRAVATGTWHTHKSDEFDTHRRLWAAAGEPPRLEDRAARIPGYALRDLSVDPASAGGYLTDVAEGGYIAAAAGDSAALRLGVRAVSVPRGAAALARPRGTAGATAYWLADEQTQITESQPTLGSVSAASKTLAAYTTVSHQLLMQGGNTESVVRGELRRAVAAALDAAILAGSGLAGQPLGIVGSSGVGAFTGGSLDQAALRNAQYDLGNAKAITDPSKVAYVAPPAVAELLAKRQRFTGSDRALWEGSSFDGTVEGVRAVSTAAAPASTVILGDWSSVNVVEFAGGLVLTADPNGGFATGLTTFRILLDCDVLLLRPAAFSVATSVT